MAEKYNRNVVIFSEQKLVCTGQIFVCGIKIWLVPAVEIIAETIV